MDVKSFFPAMKKQSANTGELAGPCPVCGGRDRFHVWPDTETGFHYLCRQCDTKGNAIKFLCEIRGMPENDARMILGLPVTFRGHRGHVRTFRGHVRTCPGHFKDKGHVRTCPGHFKDKGHVRDMSSTKCNVVPPPKLWMQQAAQLLTEFQDKLEVKTAQDFLKRRGIAIDTARRCGLGWNDRELYLKRTSWGLAGEELFRIPAGMVITNRRAGHIISLTVRQMDKLNIKYWQVAGSMESNVVFGRADMPAMIFESVLDAVVVIQESGFKVSTVGMFGASKPFDTEAARFIEQAPFVLLCPDADASGAAALVRWQARFPKAKAWLPRGGKDPGEMLDVGADIAEWVKEGVRGFFPPAMVVCPTDDLPTTYIYKSLCACPQRLNQSPACDWWPQEQKAQFERKHGLSVDLRGMGIDACALPEVLRGFSATGWKLELTASGEIRMVAASHDARNEDGNRDYFGIMQDQIRKCLECLNGAIAVCDMDRGY